MDVYSGAGYDGWAWWRARIVPARYGGYYVEVDRMFLHRDWQRWGEIRGWVTGWPRRFKAEAKAQAAATAFLKRKGIVFDGRVVET